MAGGPVGSSSGGVGGGHSESPLSDAVENTSRDDWILRSRFSDPRWSRWSPLELVVGGCGIDASIGGNHQ